MEFTTIVEYLCELFPELEFGKNIFINSVPTDLKRVGYQVLLRDVFAGVQIDKDIPNYRHGRFLLASRGYDYMETREATKKISKALTLIKHDFDGIEIKSMRPLNEPVSFMNSDGGYHEFSVNFTVIYGLRPDDEQ